MRLENRPYFFKAHIHCGIECCGKLCRVVSKIVCHCNSLGCTENFKTAVNTSKFVEIFGDFLRCCTKVMCGSRCGKCIINIMLARNNQLNICKEFALVIDVKLLVNALVCRNIFCSVVAVFAKAVGDFFNVNIVYCIKCVLVITVDYKQTCSLFCKFIK